MGGWVTFQILTGVRAGCLYCDGPREPWGTCRPLWSHSDGLWGCALSLQPSAAESMAAGVAALR